MEEVKVKKRKRTVDGDDVFVGYNASLPVDVKEAVIAWRRKYWKKKLYTDDEKRKRYEAYLQVETLSRLRPCDLLPLLGYPPTYRIEDSKLFE